MPFLLLYAGGFVCSSRDQAEAYDEKKGIFMGKKETRLIVEKDTVYELDMECLRRKRKCKENGRKHGKSGETDRMLRKDR